MKRFIVLLSLVIGFGYAQDCEEGFRLFDHEMLTTEPVCIPENPERILSLDRLTFETMLALGVKPVATLEGYVRNHQLDFPYRAETVEGIREVGNLGGENLEVMTEVAPDLIIVPAPRYQDELAIFSQIAPVVAWDFTHSGEWREVAEMTAELLGEEEGYAALSADYEARVTALETVLGEDPPVLSVVRVRENETRLYVRDSFAGSVIADAGIPRPDSQALGNEEIQAQFNQQTFYAISREQLPLADGDIIVVFHTGSSQDIAQQAAARREALADNALWNALFAVQAGEVYDVGGYWIGSSFIAAHEVLDDLFQVVAKTEPTVPNPFEE